MEDTLIVDLFLRRDERALSAVQEKYGKGLRSVAAKICGDAEVARECENDAYFAAWNSIPPQEPRNTLFAYLAALVRRRAINRLKEAAAAKRSAVYVSVTTELEECLSGKGNVEKELEAKELVRAINAWLRALPPEKRALFLRRYWYSDTLEEMQKRFSRSESDLKSALYRLRKELKKVLEKEGFSC